MTDFLQARRALAWVLALGLAVSGALLVTRMPSGIYPEMEFPRIVVVARSGDAPAALTQVSLGRPLETALATVQGVERVRSRAIRGAVEISLLFAPGSDMWRALQLTESRVGETRSALPVGADVVVERLTTTSFPVVTFNVSGDLDSRRIRDLAELVLRPAISRVPGVGRVEVLGGDVREIEIIVDPARAAALRLTPARIAEKVRDATVLQAVGRFDDAHALVTVMASGEPREAQELGRTPVALGADGSPVPLKAIATIEEGAEDRLLRVSAPEGETVLVSVSRLPGASTPDVVSRVRAAVDETARSFPAAVTVRPVYDQAVLVDESMRSVRDAILIGIGLCVAVIALFLRDLRGGLVAALAVPITLGITFIPVHLMKQSLNLMSLGGLAIAIGLVVDDAIVVVEALRRRIERGEDARQAAAGAVRELRAALLGTTVTTVIVFLPLAWLEGVVGHFFTALAGTLAAAVLLSLVVAVTVVPLAASRWMKARTTGPTPASSIYGRGYRALVEPLLRRPWLGVAIAAALLVGGGVAARHVGTGFLPEMDEGAFVVDYFLPAGTSLTDTDAVARKIEAVLKSLPEVATYSRRTGAELGPAAATEVSRGDIMVRLKPPGARDRGAEEVIAATRARVEREVPEARVEFVQVLQDILNDLSGTPRPLEVKVFGADYGVLRETAAEIAARLEGIPGLVDLYRGFEGEAPELRLRLDPDAAARFGTTDAEIANGLDVALHGQQAAVLRRPDRPIGVRVRYSDAVRFDGNELERLPILPASGGGIVSLGAVTRFERVSSPSLLLRENLRPTVIVTADHEGRDLGSIASDARERLRGLRLPEGYTVELGGQVKAQEDTFRALARVLAFGLLGVFAVLLAQFRHARVALIVLLAVPLAVVGAVVTLVVADIPLNASSLMGCVLLVGLVVKNGILLLEQAESLWRDGTSLEAALLEAGSIRVRPILMTTLATIAGLAPLALGIGAGAEIQRPLAWAVIGGLVVSTAVSLLVMPALVRLAFWRSERPSGPRAPLAAPAGLT
jgi:CzcA family heavy metal efflux pump